MTSCGVSGGDGDGDGAFFPPAVITAPEVASATETCWAGIWVTPPANKASVKKRVFNEGMGAQFRGRTHFCKPFGGLEYLPIGLKRINYGHSRFQPGTRTYTGSPMPFPSLPITIEKNGGAVLRRRPKLTLLTSAHRSNLRQTRPPHSRTPDVTTSGDIRNHGARRCMHLQFFG